MPQTLCHSSVMAAPAAELYAEGGISVHPLSDAIGAELRGVDLSQGLSDTAFAAIHRAWLEHGVVLLRGQRLGDADLVRFSRRFGDLDLGPTMAWQPAGGRPHPEIFVISNVLENGRAIGFLGSGEADWHTDMSHAEVPPKASTLYSLEIPADGSGQTGFMNMYRVLEALPSDLRARLDGLRMKHDPAHTLQGELRDGYDEADFADIATAPGPVHPLVRTHPETGRKALYLGRGAERRAPGGLHPRPAASRIRCAAGGTVGHGPPGAVRLVPRLAGRRFRDVGQPLRHAPPRRLRPRTAPHHAPHPDQGRRAAGVRGVA